MFPFKTLTILACVLVSCSSYFLNDEKNAVYFFNSEKNKDTWTNSKTVCNLLGADLVTLSGDDVSFLGDLKSLQLWSGVRTDKDDVTKYVNPDGSPFTGKLTTFSCTSSTCCGVYMWKQQLYSDSCESKRPYVCKFAESFTELKPKFDMIDTIRGQLENFNKTMEDYNLRFVGIEEGQSRLELKLTSYNETLSADISRTSKLAADVSEMAQNLTEKQKEIVEGTATKLFDLEGRVDEKLDDLRNQEKAKFDELNRVQVELSATVKTVQEKVDKGQSEMLESIKVMDDTMKKQTSDMKDKLSKLTTELSSLKQTVDKQVKDIEMKFDANLTTARAAIDNTIGELEEHISKTDDFMSRIQSVKDSLDEQFGKTKELVAETDGRVKELDGKTEAAKKLLDTKQVEMQQTMVYVNNTLDTFRDNIAADEKSLKTLKTATYTILSLLIVAVLIQYAYIFRHKLAKLNPANRTANIES